MPRKKTTQKPGIPPKLEKKPVAKKSYKLSPKQRLIVGGGFLTFGFLVLFSIISYFFTWKLDQSELGDFSRENNTDNLINVVGANIGDILVFKGVGIMAFSFPILLLLTGVSYFFGIGRKSLKPRWFWGIYLMVLGSIVMGYFSHFYGLLSGTIGFEINDFLQSYLGKLGTLLIIVFFGILYLVLRLDFTPEGVAKYFKSLRDTTKTDLKANATIEHEPPVSSDKEESKEHPVGINDFVPVKKPLFEEKDSASIREAKEEIPEKTLVEIEKEEPLSSLENITKLDSGLEISVAQEEEPELEMEVAALATDDEVKKLGQQLVEDFGEFDPTLELGQYQFPTVDLLKDYTDGQNNITIDQEELEGNKNRIVETLKNYKIEIAHIKAAIGPTVTLYEIVPEAGIRISKIKNLEDDIALSLAALGIRIIAPMPGKGTIGIEVPNKKSTIVSMHSAIKSAKFQNAEMELPISFGKTISNETFVVDLAKMPHLLMAGATGQGKSVGLNAILTSILYKKHPAEVKFVLVDPKKVELTLYNKIERHFLAKLPDSEEAIITDNSKVINTLNSLCIEMDARYELLKNAYVRNIKEYNAKFKRRQLNPENGHRFLPYIVLVVDEFADLIMTAGKEVEIPIARLAQLARAIGIHLIIATQRPSVNVITGMIKANFPARVAFRVMSKIDSRTILDAGGADQLIGRGDMLYTNGNNLVRIQCAFVDTPEVEKITNYIGAQKAYPNAHLLPEYVGEDGGGTNLDIDKADRDKLFKDAAEVIVTAQQGSASLIQRKLKLGYNRAGRIIDQLEAAGIVGPFEGSKARQVLIPDLVELERFLENE